MRLRSMRLRSMGGCHGRTGIPWPYWDTVAVLGYRGRTGTGSMMPYWDWEHDAVLGLVHGHWYTGIGTWTRALGHGHWYMDTGTGTWTRAH